MKYIIAYQKANGLLDDGIIGPITLRSMLAKWKLSKMELSHFLGQTHHETGGFKLGTENLNYSAKRMLEIFKYDFDTNRDKWLSPQEKEKVKELIGNPEKIANFVYANQGGNGDEKSGDGWKFIGRGAIQLSLRGNYYSFSKFVKDSDIMVHPEKVETDYFFEAGLWYFGTRRLWRYANEINENSIRTISKIVNGGYNGIDDRITQTFYYWNLIKSI